MLLLRDINAICNNRINIAEKDCRPENNFFYKNVFIIKSLENNLCVKLKDYIQNIKTMIKRLIMQ